jgi:hypothetical protein
MRVKIQTPAVSVLDMPALLRTKLVTPDDGAHLKVKEFEHEPVFESESASSP